MMLETFLVAGAAVLLLMTFLWMVSLRAHDASLVDFFWGPAFVLAAWVYQLRSGVAEAPWRLLPLVLVTLWGLRLAMHIAARHHGEDRRYRKMRERRKETFAAWSLVGVFWLQGVLAAVISLPLLFALTGERTEGWTAIDLIATLIFLIGFTFEALGDWQLTRFKAEPENRGKVLDHGLWRYTRHPNYFGDAVVWWSFGLFAAQATNGVYTFGSVLLMTFFLLKVSGVALLEKDIAERRPAYRRYIEQTSAFFPWFPKRRSAGH